MNKFSGFFQGFYMIVLKAVATVAISVIFLMSLISTCYRASDSREITYFCKDSIVKNIIFIVLFLGVLVILRRFSHLKTFEAKLSDDVFFAKIKKIVLMLIFSFGLIWVLFTQFVPGTDQMDVVDCAYKLYAGEYNMLEPGGYMDKWPNQVGPVLLDYLLARIWGDFNITAFQILNVIGLTLLYKKTCDIMAETGASRLSQIVTLFCGIIFYPVIMYTTFVYGTIWHLTLALVAFHSLMRYLQDYKWWRTLECGCAMALAILVKSNAEIFLIALVIYLLVDVIVSHKQIVRKLLILIPVVIMVFMALTLPTKIIKKMTGYELNQGVSPWAYFAMGMQESEEEYPPGWWNGYNNQSYQENGYNTSQHKESAKQEITRLANNFAQDKKYAVDFYSRKLASMWIEPTFQGFWINQIRMHRVKLPVWISNLLTANSYTKAANKLDFLQSVMYLCVLIWLITESTKEFNKKSIFILSFTGGFIFHIFWEAKSQYSVVYAILLLPCAVMGIEKILDSIQAIHDDGNKSQVLRLNLSKVTVAAIALVSVMAYIGLYNFSGGTCLTQDNDEYAMHLAEWEQPDNAESELEIAELKGAFEYDEGMMIYLNHLLEENGIKY